MEIIIKKNWGSKILKRMGYIKKREQNRQYRARRINILWRFSMWSLQQGV
jgi:hypothetical protein